jgi:hypothetical protein
MNPDQGYGLDRQIGRAIGEAVDFCENFVGFCFGLNVNCRCGMTGECSEQARA